MRHWQSLLKRSIDSAEEAKGKDYKSSGIYLPGITRCGNVPPHLVVHLRSEKTDNAVLPYSV